MSKKQIAATYDLVASTFDQIGPRFFSYSGCRLVELAQIPRRARVLDVATGRGAILFPASERVGQHGHVIGVDRSVGMVHEVARDVRHKGLRKVKIYRRLGFANGTFDYVLCGHAIYYFPQAVHDFYRILKPRGQVGITIVAKGCLDWVLEILNPHPSEENERENEGSITINTAVGLEKVLGGAGFEGIQVVEEETDCVYVDEEAWWSALRTWGVRGALEKMNAEAADRVKTAVFDYVQTFKQTDGIHIRYRVLYAMGSKASQ